MEVEAKAGTIKNGDAVELVERPRTRLRYLETGATWDDYSFLAQAEDIEGEGHLVITEDNRVIRKRFSGQGWHMGGTE